MKLSKGLFLAFAGLGLFACSNEDVNEGGINGDATVGVHISGVASRAGDTEPVDVETITVTLSASTAEQNLSQTFTTIEEANSFKWTKVRNPRSITVSVNGGKDDSKSYTIEEVQKNNYAAPLYGTTSTYTTTSESDGTPLYTYSLTLTNSTIARVEFSEISHGADQHGTLGCYFSTINWNGIFLNNIKESSNGVEQKYTSWNDAKLKSEITGSFLNWTSSTTYAWNVFPGTPTLTFSFKDITLVNNASGDTFVNGNGYAAVTGYQTTDGTPITSFEAGKIYRITGIEIEDGYIGGTVEPTKPVNVQAVVTITAWDVVSGTVTWN